MRAAGATVKEPMCAGQAEAGFGCPITMTFAAVPALRVQPDLAAEWEPLLTSPGYDGALVPAQQKGSAKVGMAMTEKQGGSDVRANTTTATALAGGGEYALRGHKWLAGDGGAELRHPPPGVDARAIVERHLPPV